MWIDVIYLILLLMAVIKGLRRGLIIAVFSALAIVLGLAAAMKLSATLAVYLETNMHMSSRWLPVLAFLLVLVAVILLVRLGAKLIEGAVDLAMMGWLNKLCGVLLYAVVYTIIWSVLLFYGVQVHLVTAKSIEGSISYPFIKPWGPVVIDGFGRILPVFKDMFAQLEAFFGRLHDKL